MGPRVLFALFLSFTLVSSCAEQKAQTKSEPAAKAPAEAEAKPAPATPKETTSRERLEADIRFLADDRLKGRLTPSKELDQAADYLAKQFEEAGWKPAAGDSMLQKYTVGIVRPDEAKFSVKINGVELDKEDYLFFPIGLSAAEFNKTLTWDVVFAGHGLAIASKGIDDYKGMDIKGKAVVTLVGAPWETNPAVAHMPDRIFGKELQASLRSAGLFVHATEDLEAPADKPPNPEIGLIRAYWHVPRLLMEGTPAVFRPLLVITSKAFDKALKKKTGKTYKKWQIKLSKKGVKPRKLKAKIEIRVDAEIEKTEASNVLAVLPGSDPKLKDEWVVLMAHYDHVGTVPMPEGKDNICNGADDNASGTAAVVEVARLLAKGAPPKRSVMAVLTSAEENGLQGSGTFSHNSPVRLDKAVLAFNVDMVGRSDGKAMCRTMDHANLFEEAVEIGKEEKLEVLPDAYKDLSLLYFTDAWNLARLDIPVVDFFTAFHAEYHTPADEVDKIKFEELTKITKVIHSFANRYAQGAKKTEYVRPGWLVIPE